MWISVALITLAYIFDSLFSLLIPGSFTLSAFSFVPNIGFMTLVLVLIKLNDLDRFLVASLTGLLVGILFNQEAIVLLVAYFLVSLLIADWKRHIGDSFFEKIMLLMAVLVIKDLIVFGMYYIFFNYHYNFITWFTYVEFSTIIFNFAIAAILIFADNHITNYYFKKDRKKREDEKIKIVR